ADYWTSRRKQRHRPLGPQSGRAGPAIALCHGPALALHQFREVDGQPPQRLVPARRRLDDLLAHHRSYPLWPARSAPERVESDSRRVKPFKTAILIRESL